MPKASEVASELRKLADSLDREPDAAMQRPYIIIPHYGEKEKPHFVNLAHLLPKPYHKKWTDRKLELGYENNAICVLANIERSIMCELIEPAKPAVYRCDPILSEAEEVALETAVAE